MAVDVGEVRRLAGLSQAGLAEGLGVSQGLVSQWERGVTAVSEEMGGRLLRLVSDGTLPAGPRGTPGGGEPGVVERPVVRRKLDTYPGAPSDPVARRAFMDARNVAIGRGVPLPSSGVFGRPKGLPKGAA